MCKSGVQPTAAAFRAEALARWDNEGGALSYGATVVQPVVDTKVCGDSQSVADVIHALNGSRRTDGRPMVKDRAALSWQAD